ncbi:MAG TPA: matrixin family metalloprotease [Rhodomicrobium sp.]|nr:matrixin family metalloprotease [Rhodomicrobium sp.]
MAVLIQPTLSNAAAAIRQKVGRMTRLAATGLAAMSVICSAPSAHAGELLRVQGHLMRWPSEAPVGRTVVTYSILTAPYLVQNDKRILSPTNCAKMHAFADIVGKSPALSEEKAKRELQSAFQAWERVAALAFVEVGNPRLANIVIGAADDPGGRAFANLSYRSENGLRPVTMALGKPEPPPSAATDAKNDDGSMAPIDQAYVCLNPNSRWKIGFDGDLDVYDLRHTFMHEIGHAIGLDHPDSTGAVMAFRYDERVRDLQPSDIDAVQRLYGAPASAE